jgi:hypothetical protein
MFAAESTSPKAEVQRRREFSWATCLNVSHKKIPLNPSFVKGRIREQRLAVREDIPTLLPPLTLSPLRFTRLALSAVGRTIAAVPD